MLNRMMCGACGTQPHNVFVEHEEHRNGFMRLVLECIKCGSRTRFSPSPPIINYAWDKRADGTESRGCLVPTADPARLDPMKNATPLTFLSAPAKRAMRGATTHVDRKTGKRTRLK